MCQYCHCLYRLQPKVAIQFMDYLSSYTLVIIMLMLIINNGHPAGLFPVELEGLYKLNLSLVDYVNCVVCI